MIEHAVGMTLDSGVTDIGLVIRPGKEEVARRAQSYLASRSAPGVNLEIIYQDPPRGVADAMALAADFAGNSPLAVIMPDNILIAEKPSLAQIIDIFHQAEDNVIGAIPMTPERAGLFGNVGLMTLEDAPENRPSRVISFSPKRGGTLDLPPAGHYYKGLTAVIFLPGWAEKIAGLSPNHEGEIDDTDLVLDLATRGRLWAARLKGQGFDLGRPEGLAAARAAWKGASGHEI